MNKTILYIHQASELYGSDKTLYYLVKDISLKTNYNVIVVLPSQGPLKELFEKNNIRVIVYPVIKVSRSFFSINNILKLPFTIAKTTKGLKSVLNGEQIDVVQSNTLAVLLGAFFAKRYKIKHIWHVHEIILKPKVVNKFYSIIVNRLSNKVVFNSKASRGFLCRNTQSFLDKSIVNLNGFDRDATFTPQDDILSIRSELIGATKGDIVLCLIGRISKWKGQYLLLEAFNELRKKHKNLKLIFVGSSPPNQEYLAENLQQKLEELSLLGSCKIISFRENIWNIWDSIDIAVIPSLEPEPFGLVAVEAMLAKKPVVCAKHGGLLEIVKEGKTGYFFEPNNAKDLEVKLEKFILNKEEIKQFGLEGYKRAINSFTLESYINKFTEIYDSVLTSN